MTMNYENWLQFNDVQCKHSLPQYHVTLMVASATADALIGMQMIFPITLVLVDIKVNRFIDLFQLHPSRLPAEWKLQSSTHLMGLSNIWTTLIQHAYDHQSKNNLLHNLWIKKTLIKIWRRNKHSEMLKTIFNSQEICWGQRSCLSRRQMIPSSDGWN